MNAGSSAPAPSPAVLDIEAIFRQIDAHERSGELDQAERLLHEHFGAEPTHAHAIHFSGIFAFRRGRMDEARRCMERALQLMPDTPLYLRNLCELYRVLENFDLALQVGQRAVTLAPDDPLAVLNLALLHYDRGEYEQALACADRSLALAPEMSAAHFERAKALLASGRLIEGWDAYEWRFRLPGVVPPLPDNTLPQWDGQPLADAPLLLIADQGFGDVFQFSRYLPWVSKRCSNITVACGPELLPFLRRFAGVRAVISKISELGEFVCYSYLSGLPRLHGTRLNNIPPVARGLHADADKLKHWRARLDVLAPKGYRRVAIAWAGRPTHKNDRSRSVQLAGFAPLAAIDKTVLISLQKGPATAEIGRYFGRAPLINLGAEIDGFDDTMAVIESVDLLISVDTAVGHLAGALGRPAWLLLAYATDWRWLSGREDTPWYPRHRLFRQQSPGAWGPVFDQVAAALEKLPS